MDDLTLLQRAFLRGSAWDKTEPESLGLGWADLPKVTGTKRGAAMVRSWQKFDANAEILANAHHNRSLIADGERGPVTEHLANLRRCPIPDHQPPADVDFGFVENDELRGVLESYRDFATGSGSWPVPGCDPQRANQDQEHSIRVNLDTSRMPPVVGRYLEAALMKVREAYAEFGLAVRYVMNGEPNEAEIAKRFEFLAGGVIGWNQFPQRGTCRQTISGRLDTSYTPSDMLIWASLECHETGHGVGLEHTRGGIMNPSILRFDPLTWRGDPHEGTMRRYFGGQPVPVDGQPLPDDPPAEFNGVFAWEGDFYRFKIATPGDLSQPNGVFRYDGEMLGIQIEKGK